MFKKKNKKQPEINTELNGTEIFLEPDSKEPYVVQTTSNTKPISSTPNKTSSKPKTKNKIESGKKKETNKKNPTDFKKMPRSEVNYNQLTTPQKCEFFVPELPPSKFWLIVILVTIAFVGIGFGYQLNLPFILLESVVAFFVSQKTILSICRSKYEDNKIEDVGTYVEQMLYSFRRNGKILTSLQDTKTVFPDCEMKECLTKAIDHIAQAQSTGNIYAEALQIIQDRFDCRRIRSLHRFLIKVEGIGGDNEIGVQALLSDRRLWLSRVDDFKKQRKTTQLDIIVACIFSSFICAATMYMLPSDVGAAKHIVARSFSTIYILINIWTVNGTLKNLVYYLNDLYTPEEEKLLLNKFRWLKKWDKRVEQKKGIKPAIMMVVIGIIALFLGYWWMTIICLLLACFVWLLQPLLRHNSTTKKITKEIEKAYPDWLLELSLLLQTDNLHVALEKTMATAPLLLQDDLYELSDRIAAQPNDVEPFNDFLSNLKVPSIHSSMRLLFSIANYGSDDETKQISELIDRNSLLMNKAEEAKNSDRLAKVTIYKFVPMGASALKLIVDMAVFMVIFISQSLSSVS